MSVYLSVCQSTTLCFYSVRGQSVADIGVAPVQDRSHCRKISVVMNQSVSAYTPKDIASRYFTKQQCNCVKIF